ncbi:hypothetical protein BABINDRAFT_160034 [Babjeviella inositovora NRRL Y-12698]|uniref:Cyclin N-terminal domain-containing protein n=1 Tax=Babjeviella inositovora NRRL Y-12698 TaxID=984486 RepID=A0A1E3QVV1_9ASCO|nr:uncharacterized protein BABINDRAFT_160034 [Babjeviella inositovora NRRL Y-12698]ODQ81795.1 hypothetical protein BABINDRAFT_160034 [Babjeviella inositovora NRRL Y-12698]
MSSTDRAALKKFVRQPVSHEMVHYLVATTESIIKVKAQTYTPSANSYPSPPTTPPATISNSPLRKRDEFKFTPPSRTSPISLTNFINNLIHYSNVQTPTLMSSLVYLVRLRAVLPANVYGIETSRHRIFLGCLIIAAKNLNDSSPLNKHWQKYTDGLLTQLEVNECEREIIAHLNWSLNIDEIDLINVLQPFLAPIKEKIRAQRDQMMLSQRQSYAMSNSSSASSSIASSVRGSMNSLARQFSQQAIPLQRITKSASQRRMNLSTSTNSMASAPSLTASNSKNSLYSSALISSSRLSVFTQMNGAASCNNLTNIPEDAPVPVKPVAPVSAPAVAIYNEQEVSVQQPPVQGEGFKCRPLRLSQSVNKASMNYKLKEYTLQRSSVYMRGSNDLDEEDEKENQPAMRNTKPRFSLINMDNLVMAE